MSGRELYQMWADMWEKKNTTVDSWDELAQDDRDVWDELAGELWA